MVTRFRSALLALTLLTVPAALSPAFAQVTVGGAPMFSNKDIVGNAVNLKDHTTLVAAVKAAGLIDTLKSKGPFTVFAPTNEAVAMLPAGSINALLEPENKAALVKVLMFHVVPGVADVRQSNGVIHVVDKVLLPE